MFDVCFKFICQLNTKKFVHSVFTTENSLGDKVIQNQLVLLTKEVMKNWEIAFKLKNSNNCSEI